MRSLCSVPIVFAGLVTAAPFCQGEFLEAKNTAAPTDCYGDPLPPGAVMRLGTIRFREALRCSVVAYAPDGKLLATGGYGGVVLWDAQSGKRKGFLESRLTSAAAHLGKNTRRIVSCLAFSSDGRYLAAGCEGETIVWEWATGKEAYLPGDERETNTDLVGFTPDDRGVFTGNAKEIRLRDWRTGKDLKKPWTMQAPLTPGENKAWFEHKAVSADGKIIAAVVFEGDRKISLGIWDVTAGRERRIEGERWWYLALSPDHTTLALFDWPGRKLSLLDVATGKVLRSWPIDWPDERWGNGTKAAIAFSPDSKSLAIAGVVWSVETGKEICKLDDSLGRIVGLCFSPDGKTLAACQGNAVEFWRLPTGKKVHDFPNHRGYIVDLAYSPDGLQLATAGSDIRLWDTRTGKLIRSFGGKHTYSIESLVFFPDGQRLATKHGFSVVIWNVRDGKELREITTPDFLIRSISVSQDGKTLFAAGTEERTKNLKPRYIRQWDLASGEERHHFGERTANIFAIAVSPDGKIVAAASDDRIVRLWDRTTGKLVHEMSNSQPDRLSFREMLSFSPDGGLLAAVCGDGGTIDLGDVFLGKYKGEVIPYPVVGMGAHGRGRIGSFAFSPDGKTILCVGYAEDTIRLVEVYSGQERLRFNASIGKIVFSPDGKSAASETPEGVALIWDISGGCRAGEVVRNRLSDKDLERLWAKLADTDAAVAHRAIWELVAGKKEAVPFLHSRVKAIPPVSTEQLKSLIEGLDADNFQRREQASRELAKLGDAAKSVLVAAAAQGGLEQRRRAEAVLAALPPLRLSEDRLRVLRAIEVFEQAGGREARQALAALAEGAAGMVETEQARAALQRLRR